MSDKKAIYLQDAIDALSNMMDIDGFRDGWAVSRANVDSMLRSLPSAQPVQRWTPCSEGLPAPEERYGKKWSEYVLVFGIGLSGTRGVAISQYYYDRGEPKESGWCEAYMYIDSGIMSEIIAWMPLPEPYKER